jgi:hypothetical protein
VAQTETDKLDRMQNTMLGLAAIAGGALWVWQGWSWGLGGLVGGIFGFLNFRWLRNTVEAMMAEGSGKWYLAGIYSFKLVIISAVLAGLIIGLQIPPVALLIGIGAMPMGILFEPLVSSFLPRQRKLKE